MDNELSAAELQLIEIMREWADDPETYRLRIECADGAYEIELSMPVRGKTARGVGRTLSEEWDNVVPSWA
jgi:hypothetical protein